MAHVVHSIVIVIRCIDVALVPSILPDNVVIDLSTHDAQKKFMGPPLTLPEEGSSRQLLVICHGFCKPNEATSSIEVRLRAKKQLGEYASRVF